MGWLERRDEINQRLVERENARVPTVQRGRLPRWISQANRAARWWRMAMVVWAVLCIVGAVFTGNWPVALVAAVLGGLAGLHLIAHG